MKYLRIILKTIAVLFIFGFIAVLIYAAPSIWNKVYVYPKLDRIKNDIITTYKKPESVIKKTDYKGVLHSHSYWSHDSRGVIGEILPAAKKAQLDFIFLSDHAHAQLDSFPRGYHGVYDNVIIEAGTERSGLMVSPMKSGILNWDEPKDTLIKKVTQNDGLVLYVHTEEKHDWKNADYQAMEIYNIHTDLIDEENGLTPLIVNNIINGKKHNQWVMREIFDEQQTILSRWDSINKFKKVVGMAAVDAHNNQNIRARYTDDGKVEWVGTNAKTISIVEPSWKEKLLLSKPDEHGWAFKFETDTYFHSFNYVNTHVFCDEFNNMNIKDNLVDGHAFIAFENLANAKGFQYYATDNKGELNAILGDSIPKESIHQLKAKSPFPVKFKLIKDGKTIDQLEDSYEYEFNPKNISGNYRLEASLDFDGEETPWIYTNPIYVY